MPPAGLPRRSKSLQNELGENDHRSETGASTALAQTINLVHGPGHIPNFRSSETSSLGARNAELVLGVPGVLDRNRLPNLKLLPGKKAQQAIARQPKGCCVSVVG